MSEKLVEIEHLQQYFPAGGYGKKKKYIQAVDDVSFTIDRGETLGLVGESGCGKSTCARTIIRMYDPTGGQIFLDGQEISGLNQKQLKPFRKKMQMIFQDPYASRQKDHGR